MDSRNGQNFEPGKMILKYSRATTLQAAESVYFGILCCNFHFHIVILSRFMSLTCSSCCSCKNCTAQYCSCVVTATSDYLLVLMPLDLLDTRLIVVDSDTSWAKTAGLLSGPPRPGRPRAGAGDSDAVTAGEQAEQLILDQIC